VAATLALLASACAVGPIVPPRDPLAEVDGDPITAAELAKSIGAPLARLEQQLYALKRQRLEILIDERLLAREAAKRGVSVDALVDSEIRSKIEPVSDKEADAVYAAKKGQFGGDAANARAEIRSQLYDQKLAARRRAFLETLRSSSKVSINLQVPPAFRPEVTGEGAPYKGGAAAPVTIVEFQDFQCPFCQAVQPALAQLAAKYGDRVKLVYRDFPIDELHPLARKAHEAARCANDQGKFWLYHDLLYANAPKLSREDLVSYAQQAGLDLVAFEVCTTARTHRAEVQTDFEEGVRVGVTGTPTFFINGRAMSGALPIEAFARAIDEELARKN
jgi:protein-disulfide isomerase